MSKGGKGRDSGNCFLSIGQTVSPQSVPTTSLEVKNGVNCEHSPVDLTKVSTDMGAWLRGLSGLWNRVQLLEAG